FFFSSRRRHTRSKRDWSSDVCSSDLGELIAAIGQRTRIISISHVAFATGYRANLKALGDACHARGIFLVVDGAQSVGAVDFNVSDLPIDILAASGDKWLLAPFGTGFTYVHPSVLDRLRVADVNWMNVE